MRQPWRWSMEHRQRMLRGSATHIRPFLKHFGKQTLLLIVASPSTFDAAIPNLMVAFHCWIPSAVSEKQHIVQQNNRSLRALYRLSHVFLSHKHCKVLKSVIKPIPISARNANSPRSMRHQIQNQNTTNFVQIKSGVKTLLLLF